jgi:protein-S-isoprenylcysteine O-methyltransferase Ste14
MASNVTSVSRAYSSPRIELSLARRASDWTGFIVFGAIGVWTLRRLPGVGVFLLPTLAHELFMAGAFLIRDREKAATRHAPAQVAAYGGTFLVFGFFHAARIFWPELLATGSGPLVATLGGFLWLAGSLLAPWSLWTLRHAFSLEAQARRMVRSGPYRHVRHPIYLGYILQYGGLLLLYPSNVFAVVLVVWFGLTLIRMRYEEQTLAKAFPEYEVYRCATGALFPFKIGKAFVRSGNGKVATV